MHTCVFSNCGISELRCPAIRNCRVAVGVQPLGIVVWQLVSSHSELSCGSWCPAIRNYRVAIGVQPFGIVVWQLVSSHSELSCGNWCPAIRNCRVAVGVQPFGIVMWQLVSSHSCGNWYGNLWRGFSTVTSGKFLLQLHRVAACASSLLSISHQFLFIRCIPIIRAPVGGFRCSI